MTQQEQQTKIQTLESVINLLSNMKQTLESNSDTEPQILTLEHFIYQLSSIKQDYQSPLVVTDKDKTSTK